MNFWCMYEETSKLTRSGTKPSKSFPEMPKEAQSTGVPSIVRRYHQHPTSNVFEINMIPNVLYGKAHMQTNLKLQML